MPRKNPRGRNARPGDKNIVKQFTDRELQYMIRNTTGVTKNFFLKEAGRRVAEEMKRGRRVARKRYGAAALRRNPRKNPKPSNARKIGTSRTRQVRGSTAHLVGISVYEIRYRHAADGKDYKHPFETDDVILLGLPDGSLKIESASGNRLWQFFDGND